MIKPNKHTNIKYSIYFLSALIMKEIEQNDIISYDELKNCLSDKIGIGVKENYEIALSFLFLLGRVEYVEQLDSIKAF